MELNKIYQGNCLDVMKEFPDNSIDTIITDPPYGISFHNRNWDKELPQIEIFQELLRVAKPGCIFFCFGSPKMFHRLAVRIEDAGWELHDTLMWLYGEGFPKSCNISKQLDKHFGQKRNKVKIGIQKIMELRGGNRHPWMEEAENKGYHLTDDNNPISEEAKIWDGYGSGLKPAWEPIFYFMKPIEKNYANNALKWQVSGLNIEEGRIPYTSQKEKEYQEMMRRGQATSKKGKMFFSDKKSAVDKIELTGRWPANLILDEESAELLDEQTKDKLHCGVSKTKQINNEYKSSSYMVRNRKLFSYGKESTTGASRFFYCAKASHDKGEFNNHPTVKPLSLMQYLCKITKTPYGGTVLDPFSGSGTTCLAAYIEERPYIGIEMEKEYINISEKRIKIEMDKNKTKLNQFFK